MHAPEIVSRVRGVNAGKVLSTFSPHGAANVRLNGDGVKCSLGAVRVSLKELNLLVVLRILSLHGAPASSPTVTWPASVLFL